MTKNNKMYQIRQNVKHYEGRTWTQNFWNRMKYPPIPISHEYLLEPDPWNRVKFHPIPGIGWTFTRSQKQMSRLLVYYWSTSRRSGASHKAPEGSVLGEFIPKVHFAAPICLLFWVVEIGEVSLRTRDSYLLSCLASLSIVKYWQLWRQRSNQLSS